MKTGTVKFYNSQKGFGFIAPDDGGKDVFVHATALEAAGMRGLVEGQKISFDVEADRRSGKDAAANLQHPYRYAKLGSAPGALSSTAPSHKELSM